MLVVWANKLIWFWVKSTKTTEVCPGHKTFYSAEWKFQPIILGDLTRVPTSEGVTWHLVPQDKPHRRLQLTWHINVTTSDVSASKWFIMSVYIFKYEMYIQKKTIKGILQITRSNLTDVHIEFKNCKLASWIGTSLDSANVLNWFFNLY